MKIMSELFVSKMFGNSSYFIHSRRSLSVAADRVIVRPGEMIAKLKPSFWIEEVSIKVQESAARLISPLLGVFSVTEYFNVH